MNVTNSGGSCPAILADGASIHRAKPTGPLSRPDRIRTSSFPIAGPLHNFLFDDRFWPLRVTRRYDRSWPILLKNPVFGGAQKIAGPQGLRSILDVGGDATLCCALPRSF